MNSDDALRFLAHEAKRCRDADDGEALCLLLPPVLRLLGLPAMEPQEAAAFRHELKSTLLNDFRYDPAPTAVGCTGRT